MAIFHLSAKVISRGKGQSAIAAAAYRSGERLFDEQAGEQKHYTSRSERIAFTDILAPQGAPEWAHDRNQLWNHAERAEKRKDAQLAREIEVALPHELTDQQREWLVKDFAREAFVRKGYAVDIAIHAPDKESDDRNHHAHLMVTRRALEPEGFAAKKDWQFDKTQLAGWREQWANLANRHLERHGHAARIDHRSLKEQGVDREPTVHLGYAANEMAQRGAPSDRMDALQAILARNDIRVDLRAIEGELSVLQKDRDRQRLGAKDRAASAGRDSRPPELPAPTRPIQDVNARHAAAEAERRDAAAQRQAQKDLAGLRAAARADERTLGEPVAKSYQDGAQKVAQEVRQDRREAFADKQQADWRKSVAARNPDKIRPIAKSLEVLNSTTGKAMKLTDFVTGLLAGSSPPEKELPVDMKKLLNDRTAARVHQRTQLATLRQKEQAEDALERIDDSIKRGENLRPADIAKLTPEHLMNIKSRGDDYVRHVIEDLERSRERDAGRGRDE